MEAGEKVDLLVVGDGPERKALQRLVADLGIGANVHLLGWRGDVADLMSLCYEVLVPSVDLGESLPAVIVEAMLAGSCVVATAAGGIPEIVKDGDTGVIMRAATVADLAAVLTELLNQPEMRHSIADNGRRYAEQQLT